jgi:uncharacterized protein involved in exopolysaccharide biosynthesis
MATNKQEQAKAIYELWDVILQHRWRFVLPAFAVTAMVLFGSLFLPRKYQATAHFERRNAPELIEAIRSGASDSYMDPMQSLNKEIAGSHAIAQVIEEVKPRLRKIGYIENEAQALQLRSRVKQQLLVDREYADHSRIQLRLELVLDNPHVAALIVNGLIDRYIHTTRSAMIDRAQSSIDYFDNLIAENTAELETRQEELGEFEQEHALLLPEQPYSLVTQIGEAKDELARLTNDLENLGFRKRALVEALDEEPATHASVVHGMNPEYERLTLKMEKLQETIREHVNKLRMTEQHPEVASLRKQEADLAARIDATPKQIVTATQNTPNPKRAELELQLTSANAEQAAIQEQITLRRQKIDELSDMSSEMLPVRAQHRKLVASVAEAQEAVDDYQNMRRRAEYYLTPEAGDRGVQLEFVRRAESLQTPVSPNLVQVVLVAIFLGIAAGTMSVFLAHRTDESFRNARQLSDATTIPLLGSVSELITSQHRRMRKLRYSVLYPANAAVMASILLLFAGVLYLDLQRPDVLKELKDRAKSVVLSPLEEGSGQAKSLGMSPSEPGGS